MAIIKEYKNQFGNGASNYWNIQQITTHKNDGLVVHIAHYFSEEAYKQNNGQAIFDLPVIYKKEDIQSLNPELLDVNLIGNIWDFLVHLSYVLVKRDISNSQIKPFEEQTDNEKKLSFLAGYVDKP